MARFCKNCGAQLGDDAQFCKTCGTPAALPQPEQQAGPAQQQYAQPVQPNQQQYVQQAQNQNVPPQPATPQQQYAQQPAPPQQQYAQQPAQPQQQYTPPPVQPAPAPQQQQYVPPAQPQGQYAAPPQQGYPQQGGAAYAAPAPKKGLSKKLIILIAIIAAAVIVGIFVVPNLLNSNADKDFFEIGGDKVPSVKHVLDEKRSISGVSTSKSGGVEKMVIEYKVKEDQAADMKEYAEALMADFDFYSVSNFDFSGTRGKDIQLAKESDKKGFIVIVDIDYNTSGYTLTISRGEGTLNIHSSSSTGDDPTGDDPTGDDPTGDDPKGDDPDPEPNDTPTPPEPVSPPPAANEVEIVVPGLLMISDTVEEAQSKAPKGVTVVKKNSDGSFVYGMSKDTQQKMIDNSKKEGKDIIDSIYSSKIPGLEELRYDGDNFTGAYMIINDAFLADSNGETVVKALIKLGVYMPWPQVWQGMGMKTQVWIAWGDADFNAVGEVISPDFLAQFVK